MQPEVPPRLLIVDDEQTHTKALCDTLSMHGFATTGCTNVDDAMHELQTARFDLMLTDLNMPGMNGIALLKRALEIDPALICVVMTGKGTIATAVEAMRSGALDFIVKPFKLSAMLPVLARALEVGQLRREKAALEAQVRNQIEELKIANSDLEAFSFSVSHDLRAPLHVIAGFSSILQQKHADQLDATGLSYLGRIRTGVKQMTELINGLLELSRLGRQSIQREPIDMGALARQVADDLRQAQVAGADCIEIQPRLPGASADPVLLRQVLANLLSNACKFSANAHPPRITIGCEPVDGVAEYFVRDNGAGFDPQHAEKLFEPFQRLHSASEFAGIGLGLSIVQRIVTRHGGRVRATAEPGHGACFHFTLEEASTLPS